MGLELQMPRLESRDALSVDSRATQSPKDACLSENAQSMFLGVVCCWVFLFVCLFLIVLSISLLGGFLHFGFES